MTDKAQAATAHVLEPWQFFLLAGMLGATAAVLTATGQSPANIIILSLTVVSASFVGLGAYRTLVPLVRRDGIDTPALAGGRTRVALEREKQLVLRSIKELEFDFAMGKMSNEDFEEMTGRLRRRALGLMRQLEGSGYREQIDREIARRLGERDAEHTPGIVFDPEGSSKTIPGVCSERRCACGTVNDADARFCKSCGSKLHPTAHNTHGGDPVL
jgi:hypothetical protein